MIAQFRLNGSIREGEVIQRNAKTTLVRVRHSKIDLSAMRWATFDKVIKRHNCKHGVKLLCGKDWVPAEFMVS